MIWIAAISAFAVTLLVPLLALAALTEEPPDIRVFGTDGRVSSLVADGGLRVLILNSEDPRTARSSLGEARPWEPNPSIVVAPSDDDAATGVLAVLRSSDPQAVIIAGLPGAHQVWHAVERECRERGIELTFTTGSMAIDSERITLTVFGIDADEDEGRTVVVRRDDGGATVAIALDRGLPPVHAHAFVTAGVPEGVRADLVITTDDDARSPAQAEVALAYRERARLVLEDDGIQVFGGTFRGPRDDDTDE